MATAALAGAVVIAVGGIAGCARPISGEPVATGAAAGGANQAEPGAAFPTTTIPTTATTAPSNTPRSFPTRTTPGTPRPRLRDHVLPSDCLLTGAQMSALAGVALDDGDDTRLINQGRPDSYNCSYYLTAGGILSFTGTIKVQQPESGPITDEIVAGLTEPGSTTVPGIARAVIITPPDDYPQMWVITDDYVVSVVLVGSNLPAQPSTAAWTTAAREVVAALPR
nr:hypothetical protein ISGA_06545 [Gordonia sp. NB41Y]